jgi:hypothetical protein
MSSPAFRATDAKRKASRRHETWSHEIGGGQRDPCGLQSEAGEGLEDDVGEALEIVEEQGKEADEEDLANELRRNVVLADRRPEQARERNVYAHEGTRQKSDVASEKPKSRIDVAAECFSETIDDAEVVHDRKALPFALPLVGRLIGET